MGWCAAATHPASLPTTLFPHTFPGGVGPGWWRQALTGLARHSPANHLPLPTLFTFGYAWRCSLYTRTLPKTFPFFSLMKDRHTTTALLRATDARLCACLLPAACLPSRWSRAHSMPYAIHPSSAHGHTPFLCHYTALTPHPRALAHMPAFCAGKTPAIQPPPTPYRYRFATCHCLGRVSALPTPCPFCHACHTNAALCRCLFTTGPSTCCTCA